MGAASTAACAGCSGLSTVDQYTLLPAIAIACTLLWPVAMVTGALAPAGSQLTVSVPGADQQAPALDAAIAHEAMVEELVIFSTAPPPTGTRSRESTSL